MGTRDRCPSADDACAAMDGVLPLRLRRVFSTFVQAGIIREGPNRDSHLKKRG
ncbi:hypothetical protein [Streptomyces sp. NPDC048611]|uniref:hypothetical protein n=1 Tax=unclassified Streptomyces TaxID=2593676 RepID=UPI0034350019